MTTESSNGDPINHAAELAELILDEVSSSDQDWRAIERWAGELAELARRVAAGPPADAPPHP